MRSRVVVDASAAMRIVTGQDTGQLAQALQEATVAIAPGLFTAEMANGLRAYVEKGVFTVADTVDRYEEALGLLDDIVPDREIGVEALTEAMRVHHPAYDLVYVVLARRTAAALLTLDHRLAELAPKLGVPLAIRG